MIKLYQIFHFIPGPLAVVSSGFVAGLFWARQGWKVNKNPVSEMFRILWIFFEPILFAFTGAQVEVSSHILFCIFYLLLQWIPGTRLR